MNYRDEIRLAAADPYLLERLYQSAQQEKQEQAFQAAMSACYEDAPDNLLYAAWFYRLQNGELARAETKPARGVNWWLAVPLSILTGLIFWLLSDPDWDIDTFFPGLILWWSPVATMSALVFLGVTAKQKLVSAIALGLGLLACAAYAMLLAPVLEVPWKINHYLDLAAIHIPLLCWVALGLSMLGFKSSVADRFAFLIKSIEVMITAGLYLIAGVAFGGITTGMFAALGIDLPELWMRLIAAGGFGLLPVLAVASVYDPKVSPAGQDFSQGLSRFIATMMRLFLPLTLGVLAIYIVVIPFNFMEPFQNRDMLIVYNLMLFAVMGLLLGATPLRQDVLSAQLQKWLRTGLVAVMILALIVSVYAMSATVYRTIAGEITINRLTIMGWNAINIGILSLLLFRQSKSGQNNWAVAMQTVFSQATNAYLVWGAFLVLAIPLLFR